jgi:hypothetical protein
VYFFFKKKVHSRLQVAATMHHGWHWVFGIISFFQFNSALEGSTRLLATGDSIPVAVSDGFILILSSLLS